MKLIELLQHLKQTPAMQSKQAIANSVALPLDHKVAQLDDLYALPGDDTAAIKMADGYLLHACEGMLPAFVENHPYFAGWSAVMANVSDIAAMGGRPLSVVNSYWHTNAQSAQQLLNGMRDACDAYGVQLVGGHTIIGSQYQPALAVAIQGTAKKLLSVFHVAPKQKLLIALNLNGKFHPNTTYWKCFEDAPSSMLKSQIVLLPEIAEQDLAFAARDISNAGILGSLLMLLEATHSGATVYLDNIPKPNGSPWLKWLQIFPSYGFLLTTDEDECDALIDLFASQNIHCAVIGEINDTGKTQITQDEQQATFWDFNQDNFTGLNYRTLIQTTELRSRYFPVKDIL